MRCPVVALPSHLSWPYAYRVAKLQKAFMNSSFISNFFIANVSFVDNKGLVPFGSYGHEWERGGPRANLFQ